MSKYGLVATAAAQLLSAGKETPRNAWTRAAIEVFPNSESSRDKGCPRVAFLSLCELGAITSFKDDGQRTYTRSVKTKAYMRRAMRELRDKPSLLQNEEQLWQIATENTPKAYNHQIEVLTSLWKAGFIHSSSQPLV